MNKLLELKDLNDKVYSFVDSQIKNFSIYGINPISIEYISYELVKRLALLIKSTNKFIDEFIENTEYELPLALIIRPALLDGINYLYILDNHPQYSDRCKNDDTQKVELLIKQYLGNNIIKNKYENEFLISNFENFTKDIYDRNIKYLKEIDEKLFNSNIFENPKDYKFPSTNEIIKNLDNRLKGLYEPSYMNYCTYGKYEHFGILTIIMNFAGKDSKEDKTLILLSSIYTINTIIKQCLEIIIPSIDLKEIDIIQENINELISELCPTITDQNV